MIDRETVRHVARLARLGLTDDEVDRMQHELSGILEHIDRIQSLPLDDVPPTTHVVPLENVVGADVPHDELTPELALREAPDVEGGGFAVPRMDGSA